MISTVELSELSARCGRLTFVFTVHREGDAWLVQDSQGAMLGRSTDRDEAIQCARRASVLMSETGVRVFVRLENYLHEFDTIFTAEPLPRVRTARLS